MSNEWGTWGSDGGQRWGAGFTVQGEVDFTKDLQRREEWSDISEDDSPVIYADISRSEEYHYHVVQPKRTELDSTSLTHETSVAIDASEGVPNKDETPTASSLPSQEGVVWRQLQQGDSPEVASESTEYPVASYPSVFCQMKEEKTEGCSLDDGGTLEEEEQKKSRDVSVIQQTVAAKKHKGDLSKNGYRQGFELEREESATSNLANGPSANLETLETTQKGLLSLDEPHAPDPCSSGQKHYNVMLPVPGASMSYREGQPESTVESGHNSAMTSREQGGSAVTVFPSSSEFSLEPFDSQQCDANPECKNLNVPSVKEMSVSSRESPPTRSDEKRILVADQHFLKECGEVNRLDMPGQGSAEVMQHPTLALAGMDSVKDRDSTQLGMGLVVLLKKPKRKVGRPLKKKTLLKMAKLLNIAQEWGGDTKDTHLGQNDMQRQNAHLDFPNEQSLPCNLSISPLPKSHIQVPKVNSSKSLKALLGNSSQHEDCRSRPKNIGQATRRKAKSKKASCKQEGTQESFIFSVPKDPQVVPETVLAQETGQSASRCPKSTKKTLKRKTYMNIEECKEDSLEQPTGSQSRGRTLLLKPVHLPAIDDAHAIQQSSKPRRNAKKSLKEESKDLRDTCEEKCNLPVKDFVLDSQTSGAGVPPHMHTTLELPKKPQKKISAKSWKADLQASLPQHSADPRIISPQKELENTIVIEETTKRANKRGRGRSAPPKGKNTAKDYRTDTLNEPELPCEDMDANELHIMTHKDTNHRVVSTSDVHEAECIDTGLERLSVPMETQTSAKDLSKQGRGPKRKGNSKAKRKVTPKGSAEQNNPYDPTSMIEKTVLPETHGSPKLSKQAPKQNTKKTSKKKAVKDKGQDGMAQIDSYGPPLKKDALCCKEHTGQSLTISQPPLREKKARKRKATDYGENGLNLNNYSVEQIPNPDTFTFNELNPSIPQLKSVKLESNIEPTPKIHGCSRPKKALKKERKKKAKSLGASQPVLIEDFLLNTDTVNLTTQVPRFTLTKQRRSHKKKCDLKEESKLSEFDNNTALQGRCVVPPQKTQETPKGSRSRKKVIVPKVESAFQDIALNIMTAETSPKTNTPRKMKEEVVMLKEEHVANRSFDFAEEEFHVPVIKVTSRNDVSLKRMKPKQSCMKKCKKDTNSRTKQAAKTAGTKSKTSPERLESFSNSLSEFPVIKPEPFAMPLSATKPVKKLSSRRRILKSPLKQSDVALSDVPKLKENSSGDNIDEQHDGKCTEIKLEQAEFALSAVDIGHPARLQQSSTIQTGSLAMLKRKAGRPFKKKTLLKMAKIFEIVQEDGSNSTETCGITDCAERMLLKNQHRPPRVKKEKETKPVVTPTRRSLRTVVSGRAESNLHSSSTMSMDIDQKGNTDSSCSSTLNRQSSSEKCFNKTLALDSNKTAVDETDHQEPQKETQVETTAVMALKGKRKTKSWHTKKRKVGWRKLCQQLASVTAAQEEVLLSSNADGNNIDVSCKVLSLPVSCKEEVHEHAILHNSNTSKAVSGTQLHTLDALLTGLEKRSKLRPSTLTQKKKERRCRNGETTLSLVEDAGVSLEVAALPPNQGRDDAELLAVQSLTKVKRSGRTYKKKTSVKKSKLMAVEQTVSELKESQLQAVSLHFPQDVTKVKTEECEQSVSVAQASKLRRSLRSLCSAPFSIVDQEQSQPTQNLDETTLSSKSFVLEAKTEMLRNVSCNEREVKDDDLSLEKQYDDLTLPCPNVQQAAPMPGQLKRKKIRKGQKRKLSSRTSGIVESAEITDTTISSDASLTVAFNTYDCQSTSFEHENVSMKSKMMIEEPVKGETEAPVRPKMKKGGKEKRAQNKTSSDVDSEMGNVSIHENHTITPDLKKNHDQESRKIVNSSEAPLRRSSRASKIHSPFHRSEEYTSAVGETTSFPAKDSQDVIQSSDKTLHPSKTITAVPTEEQVVSAVSSDTAEISVSDIGCEPDLETRTPVDREITPAQDSSPPVSKTAEAQHLIVEKKKRRRKKKRRKSKTKGTHNAVQVIEQPVVQNKEATVITEVNENFAHYRQLNGSQPHGEISFASEPLEDSEVESHPTDGDIFVKTVNVLVDSGCQTSVSLNMLSSSQVTVQTVDGCTQYSEDSECREQRIISKFPAGQNVKQQLAKKARTYIMCRFCGRSFRHISAYTVHQRLHTGERPYQCQQCGKRFAQLSKLKLHRNVHKVPGLIQCPCCSQRFSKKEQLISHFKVHLPNAGHISSDEKSGQASHAKPSAGLANLSEGVFNCPVCGKDLPSERKLHIHKRTHKGEGLSCKDCGKTFSKPSSLSAHERVHWPLQPYACSVCGKGFSKLQVLKIHSLEHTGATPFFCSHCGYACNDLPTLRAHQASRVCFSKKPNDIEGFLVQMGVDGQVNTPSLFKCHLCKKLLNHWCQYILHLQTHTKAHPYLCDTCGQSYERDSDVRAHCRDCCRSSGEEKACSGPLSDIWNSQETEKSAQISQEPDSPEHMNEHCLILNDQSFASQDNSPVRPDMLGEDLPQSKSPHPIPSCTEDPDPPSPGNSQPPSPTRSDVSILSSHPSLDCYVVSSIRARTRTSHKRFDCQHCGQTFRLSSILHAHLQTHLSGNKYTCGLCGRVFQRWHRLWLHQRLHQEKGRSFSCSECNIQFRFLNLYREHLREHAEHRPYACPLCLETFLSEGSLNTHQCENHRPCQTLKCEVCGKGFSSLRNWVKHSLLHNGRSSHSCLLCNQSFSNNRALQDHLKKHNNDLRFPASEIPSEPLLFPHQCWMCNASFSTGELLYAHQICHAVGGKPPARPRGAPTGHRTTNGVMRTMPPPTVPEPSSVPEPAAPEQVPVPEIRDESLFVYAHPDSLYVVPDPSPPPPPHTHSFSWSGGLSSSQATNLTSSQQVIVLDEEVNLGDTADTSQSAPGTSQTIPNSSSNEDGNLPQTSSQQSINKLLSGSTSSPIQAGSSASSLRDEPTLSLQVQHTLPPRHNKSKDAGKSFSITVQLQDTRGFECADCNISLSSVTQLHKHYLKHAKGVLGKIHI